MDYPYLGGLLTMDTNHLPSGMILQVRESSPNIFCQEIQVP